MTKSNMMKDPVREAALKEFERLFSKKGYDFSRNDDESLATYSDSDTYNTWLGFWVCWRLMLSKVMEGVPE